MKVLRLKFLLFCVLASALSGCEKSSEAEQPADAKATPRMEQVYPAVGTDLPNSILPKEKLPRAVLIKGFRYTDRKFKLIDTICEEYLSGTKLFDFSYLTAGVFTNQIENEELTIQTDLEFGGDEGFIKLNAGPNGWWTHWNYSPYTQYEYPSVLLSRGKGDYDVRSIYLSFSKNLTSLGFEVAPNITGKNLKVHVQYMSWTYRDPSLCEIDQIISSPSGARLIAMKSEVPFNYAIIQVEDGSFAISNLRYTLAR